MPAFRTIIKGDMSEVIRATESRGLMIGNISKHPSYPECIAVIGGETDKVLAWFCEGNKWEAPYPAGTLMWYSLESQTKSDKRTR